MTVSTFSGSSPTLLLRSIVGCGLPGVAAPPIDSGDDLVTLLPWAAEHRLVGLLYEAALLAGQRVDEIDRAHLAILRQVLAVEAEAGRAIEVLRNAGTEPVVFKGVAAAHLDFENPGNRSFYDVDVLLARVDFGVALDALEAAGWRRLESRLGRRWEQRFARATTFISDDGVELDVHAMVAAGYFGVQLDEGALREQTVGFDLGGVTMTAFDVDARLLTSCFAVVLSRGGSLRLVRDVAQQVLVSCADWERAGTLSGEGNVVVARAFEAVNPWIELPEEAMAWAGRVAASASRRQLRGLAFADRAQQSGWRDDAIGELMGLGPVDRLAYAVAVGRSRLRRSLSSRSG